MKVQGKEIASIGLWHSSSIYRSLLSFLILWKMRVYELIQFEIFSKKRAQPPKIPHNFKQGASDKCKGI